MRIKAMTREARRKAQGRVVERLLDVWREIRPQLQDIGHDVQFNWDRTPLTITVLRAPLRRLWNVGRIIRG